MLVLAAEDDLVPSKLVREMLQQMNHPCEVLPLHPVLCVVSICMVPAAGPRHPHEKLPKLVRTKGRCKNARSRHQCQVIYSWFMHAESVVMKTGVTIIILTDVEGLACQTG